MLHLRDKSVRKNLLSGHFEIKKDMLRIDRDGFMSHADLDEIESKFCDCRLEICSGVQDSAARAVEELESRTRVVQRVLKEHNELLWPFSAPPYIRDWNDIIVKNHCGPCEYLAKKYGRYKMTLCGVHLNFSFDEQFLKDECRLANYHNFAEFKDRMYLHLAKQMALYGWLITLLTAASPLTDRSFVEKGVYDGSVFSGLASLRNSEFGFWNHFTPCFEYSNLERYVKSIEQYVEEDLLQFPSELFFPVRLLPAGEPNFMALKENGVDHIELRMFDLNPYEVSGIDVRDIEFAQLFMVWLVSLQPFWVSHKDSVQLVQNFKNASHYDLKTVYIHSNEEDVIPMIECALNLIEEVELFFKDANEHVQDVIQFEKKKCSSVKYRYAYRVLQDFSKDFVKCGVQLAKENQDKIL